MLYIYDNNIVLNKERMIINDDKSILCPRIYTSLSVKLKLANTFLILTINVLFLKLPCKHCWTKTESAKYANNIPPNLKQVPQIRC